MDQSIRGGSMKDFQILNKLGEGSFSSVYKVKRLSDGQEYAMKKVKLGMLKDKEKENALNEVRILASLNEENIVGYKEAFLEDQSMTLCVIMEFANGGDLQKKTFFPEFEVWKAIMHMTKGLKVLHDMKIYHRDLKCANIFLTKAGSFKLGDLNVSKVAKQGLVYTQTGTPYYASPEVWRDEPYDHRSDIWSLGCILYEMCALKPPFRANDMEGLFKKVQKGIFDRIPTKYSKELQMIISSCLQVNQNNRPSCDGLLNNPQVIKNSGQDSNRPQSAKIKQQQSLLQTIQLPKNLNQLKGKLPKANYANIQEEEEENDINNPFKPNNFRVAPQSAQPSKRQHFLNNAKNNLNNNAKFEDSLEQKVQTPVSISSKVNNPEPKNYQSDQPSSNQIKQQPAQNKLSHYLSEQNQQQNEKKTYEKPTESPLFKNEKESPSYSQIQNNLKIQQQNQAALQKQQQQQQSSPKKIIEQTKKQDQNEIAAQILQLKEQNNKKQEQLSQLQQQIQLQQKYGQIHQQQQLPSLKSGNGNNLGYKSPSNYGIGPSQKSSNQYLKEEPLVMQVPLISKIQDNQMARRQKQEITTQNQKLNPVRVYGHPPINNQMENQNNYHKISKQAQQNQQKQRPQSGVVVPDNKKENDSESNKYKYLYQNNDGKYKPNNLGPSNINNNNSNNNNNNNGNRPISAQNYLSGNNDYYYNKKQQVSQQQILSQNQSNQQPIQEQPILNLNDYNQKLQIKQKNLLGGANYCNSPQQANIYNANKNYYLNKNNDQQANIQIEPRIQSAKPNQNNNINNNNSNKGGVNSNNYNYNLYQANYDKNNNNKNNNNNNNQKLVSLPQNNQIQGSKYINPLHSPYSNNLNNLQSQNKNNGLYSNNNYDYNKQQNKVQQQPQQQPQQQQDPKQKYQSPTWFG